MLSSKREWQRRQRRQFVAEHGYSTAAHYSTGGLRKKVLERDGYACVKCGLTDAEHRSEWERPITVDHIDKDRGRNRMDNLQALCLRCHGRKDIVPALTVRRLEGRREEILRRRTEGQTYQQIADDLGYSIAAVWKWLRRWLQEETR